MATFAKALMWLVHWLPPSVAWVVSGMLARLLVLLRLDLVRITDINLGECFDDLDAGARAQITQDSVRHMLFLFFEFGYLAHWPEEKLLGHIGEVEGKVALDEAYAKGRGVMLLVPHYGNWELMCLYLGKHYDMAALYDPPKVQNLEPVIRSIRERFAGQLFPIDTGGLRSVLKLMRKGCVTAILPDQVPARNAGVYADFFGKPALTMTLPHRIVAKYQPEPLMGWVSRDWRGGKLSYRLTFQALPMQINEQDDLQVQQTACAGQINQAIQNVIAGDPAQYQWEYKRFKRPPGGGRYNIYKPEPGAVD